MLKRNQLHCSQEQFEELHEDLAKVRSTSSTVKVSKDALRALLMDHSNLLQRFDHE
jgi:hypothetical protein